MAARRPAPEDTHLPRHRLQWLLDLARKLRAQGVEFEALFATDDLAIPTPRRGLWKWTKHVVNTAMATKASALSWRRAVVEFMYSLEHLFSVFGDPAFADRLERVAFNALPATFAPDMWSHQYDQQVNQAQCTINTEHGWTTNGPESNLYGLEPNYGCCTSNMHQGWPKLVPARSSP